MNAELLIISTANEIFNHYMNRRYKKGDVTTVDILKKFAESYAEAKSKEVAEKAWNDCEEDVANHYLDSKDCLYESFDDWYSNYKQQSHETEN